jgi:hypothetical protein
VSLSPHIPWQSFVTNLAIQGIYFIESFPLFVFVLLFEHRFIYSLYNGMQLDGGTLKPHYCHSAGERARI